MERKITKSMLAWKNGDKNATRQPLLIYGARQVGKTYIMQEFGHDYYKNTVYINFERMPHLAVYFENDISPNVIIPKLETVLNVKIIPEDTLVIFDEIQACERALTSLKYFAEEAPEYHVAAGGSLLGVAVNRDKYSFPVGKVKMLTLYPFDFEEFLWAIDKKHYAVDIRDCFAQNRSMPDIHHEELLSIYRQYLVVGGMPAVIKEYISSNSLTNVSSVQDNILNSYLADMGKYATKSESMKIESSYNSMPFQLAKENKKFQYKLIRKGATANLFGESIQWLISAGVVIKCDKIEHGKTPLEIFRDISAFKLYMSDIGLYIAKSGMFNLEVLNGNYDSTFKGALAESYVAQNLIANGHKVYYWESNATAEVDFVIQSAKGKVVPVEVKSGGNVKAKSLGVFMSRYENEQGIRISAKNFGLENNIKSVPLYAVFCI